MTEPIISVRDLTVRYRTKESVVYAADHVSFDLQRGKVLALIGESGAGKTTAAHVHPSAPPAADRRPLRRGPLRWPGPRSPWMSAACDDPRPPHRHDLPGPGRRAEPGAHVGQPGRRKCSPATSKSAKRKPNSAAIQILDDVGLSDPERVAKAYPFQLSGGMCQRVMIGIATALNPDVIIADEPTSALDVTDPGADPAPAQACSAKPAALPSSSSPMTSASLPSSPTKWPSCMPAVSSNRLRRGNAEGAAPPVHARAARARCPRLDGPTRTSAPFPAHPPELAEPAEHCPFIRRCQKVMSVCRAEPPPPLAAGESNTHPVACYNPIWQA